MKWRIETRGRFYDPGESTVVYYATDSGDTHLLSAFAAFVIRQFEHRPLTADELADKISPAIEPGQAPDLVTVLHDVLEELTTLDILKRA
jgi:hypothetical protein